MNRFYLILGLLLTQIGPVAAQTYVVDLQKQALAIPASSFKITKVVDARADRTTLGTVQQGLDNLRAPAQLRQSLDTELLAFVDKQTLTVGARPVLLRIHKLKITEETRINSERATAEIAADFLIQDGEQYHSFLSVASGVESRGLDVTGHHASNLAKTLTNCLLKLAALPPTQMPPLGAALTWLQVQQGEGYTPYLFPVQQTKAPKRGIYRTFQEFQNDNPSVDTEPFEVVNKPRTGKQWEGLLSAEAQYLLKYDVNGERIKVRNAWGLSDGHDVYILQRGSYFQLTPVGTSYRFTGFAPADPNDVTTGALLGGVVGAAIANATSNASMPMDYEMSVATGNLQLLRPVKGFAAPADTATIYLYRRTDASPTTPLRVLVNGKLVGTLGPDQYLPLAWNDRRHDMAICIEGTEETCHTFLPIFGRATYLVYDRKSAADKPTVRAVAQKEGVFHIKHLKARDKRGAI